MPRWMVGLAIVMLAALGEPRSAAGQSSSTDAAVMDSPSFERQPLHDSAGQSTPGPGLSQHQRKVTRQLGELEPVLEWQWGAIGATVLAMLGAFVLTLPVALVYRGTKPSHEYDPGVMHSSLILAPTIAGILIVIQGSLAMAFSLAGVAAAVRFRNSVKDTNDAVYVFVAVAIGLAAGGQALDIALAISIIFSAVVLFLSKTPFRITGNPHHPAHSNPRHDHSDLALTNAGYITIRGKDPGKVRSAVEACLERETKHWTLVNQSLEAPGLAALRYAVRFRKRYPRDLLLRDLTSLARSPAYMVEATPAPPDAVTADPVPPLTSEVRA